MIGALWHRFNHNLDRVAVPLALVFFVAAVWASSYGGRVNIHHSQITACMRGGLDRVSDIERDGDNADFLQLAHTRAIRAGDYDIAAGYLVLRDRALGRIKKALPRIVKCSEAYKDPALFELPAKTPPDAKGSGDPSVKPVPRLSSAVRHDLS